MFFFVANRTLLIVIELSSYTDKRTDGRTKQVVQRVKFISCEKACGAERRSKQTTKSNSDTKNNTFSQNNNLFLVIFISLPAI